MFTLIGRYHYNPFRVHNCSSARTFNSEILEGENDINDDIDLIRAYSCLVCHRFPHFVGSVA